MMAALKYIARTVAWIALGALAFMAGRIGAVVLFAWLCLQRDEIDRLRRTAAFWQSKCRTMSQDVDKVIAHATAPSPEEELLVATRRKMILQWGEEGKRE